MTGATYDRRWDFAAVPEFPSDRLLSTQANVHQVHGLARQIHSDACSFCHPRRARLHHIRGCAGRPPERRRSSLAGQACGSVAFRLPPRLAGAGDVGAEDMVPGDHRDHD